MQKTEISEQFNERLDSFVGLKIRCIGQSPYKDDCWKIFIEAPTNTTADELKDSIQELFDPNSAEYKLKLELLEQLHNMLREWIYARVRLEKLA